VERETGFEPATFSLGVPAFQRRAMSVDEEAERE
jgi:hypothetical protein